MDPNAAWKELSDAYQDQDADRYVELAEGLLEWLRKGGFPPTITKHQAFDRMVALALCTHARDVVRTFGEWSCDRSDS